MSTKMYCFRIRKSRLWKFVAAARKLRLEEHWFVKRMFDAGTLPKEERDKMAARIYDKKFMDYGTAELQLFDEGDLWLVRPIEMGWFTMNAIEHGKLNGVELVIYDNRSDVPKSERKNKRVADRVDRLIRERKYLLLPLTSEDDLQLMFWDSLLRHKGFNAACDALTTTPVQKSQDAPAQ